MEVNLFKKIKEKLFNLYAIRALKKNDRRVENLGFKNADKIGIIYKYNSDFQPNVISFIKKLKKYGKKVESICFIEEGQKDFNYQCSAFSYKDISLLGTILDTSIEKFIDTAYDYLFYIDFNANCIIKYLIAKSKAKCKLGFYNQDFSPLLDLMVNFAVKKNTIPRIDETITNGLIIKGQSTKKNKKQNSKIPSKNFTEVEVDNIDLQSRVTLLKELMRCVEIV